MIRVSLAVPAAPGGGGSSAGQNNQGENADENPEDMMLNMRVNAMSAAMGGRDDANDYEVVDGGLKRQDSTSRKGKKEYHHGRSKESLKKQGTSGAEID